MILEGKHTFTATRTLVWEVLTNPRHLANAIPGCQSFEEIEPGKFDATVEIGISAVKGTYSGTAEIVDPVPPERCRLIGEGSGKPGFIKGEALIELFEQGESTVLSYRGEGQVGGLIAGAGQRMIIGIGKMLVGQFFKQLQNEIETLQ
ncbi:MAG: carbon monoxide dehydrogenase [Anaerolineales bacterium]|nr:carbon monoxide dehydrogenase [Anaerolineales bacterium]